MDKLEARDGEVLVLRVVRRELAEKAFGSLKVSKRRLEEAMREAEDEYGAC